MNFVSASICVLGLLNNLEIKKVLRFWKGFLYTGVSWCSRTILRYLRAALIEGVFGEVFGPDVVRVDFGALEREVS
jgi:hypothetical protein